MPMYDFVCRSCGHVITETFAIDDDAGREQFQSCYHTCADGTFGQLGRKFSFRPTTDVFGDGYFDHSVGAFVTSKSQLDDINKAKSEAHTLRTGVETNFVAHRIEDAAPRLRPDD